MAAVFAAATRSPLTAVASVVEMTGDFKLVLPVMLAVSIATVVSRRFSYGTIYTTKLLRRGQDIDRAVPWRAFTDMTAEESMRGLAWGEPITTLWHLSRALPTTYAFMSARSILLTGDTSDLAVNLTIVLASTAVIFVAAAGLLRRALSHLNGGQ